MVLLLLPLVALYIVGIGLVALPIALGSGHWGTRLASLFGISLLFGLSSMMLGIQSEITIGLLPAVLLVAGGWSSSLNLIRFLMTVLLSYVTVATASSACRSAGSKPFQIA